MQVPEIPLLPHATAWVRDTATRIYDDLHPLHVFALIGLLLVLYLAERALDFVFFHFATPAKPLAAYRRRGPAPTYALVTGVGAAGASTPADDSSSTSNNIGFGIARALVRQGYGVILLGSRAADLAAAAAALRDALVLPDDADPALVAPDEYVRTVVLDPRTATPDDMEAALRAAIVEPGLRVSILVNNSNDSSNSTTTTTTSFRPLATCTPDDIDDAIAQRARFPARLTALLLPVLAHRGAGVDARGMSFGTHRRSLVLNVGAAARGAVAGAPGLVLDSAASGFGASFGRALARELDMDPRTRHVDVLGVAPGAVLGQGTSVPPSSSSRWTPDAEAFGRWVVDKADGAVGRGWREMRPYWLHHLQDAIQPLISEKRLTRSLQNVARAQEDAIFELQHARPKDE